MRVLLASLLWAVSVAASAQPARILIAFKPEASPAERASALKRLGVAQIAAISELDSAVAQAPEGRVSIESLQAQALAIPSVLALEEDFFANWLRHEPAFQNTLLPSWAEIREQLPLPKPGETKDEIPWGVARVNAPAAWSATQGEGVRVAVIDTGIDAAHPDLRGNVAGGHNSIPFGGNSTMDDNGHGSHVAGTIAAAKNGQGVVGIAPKSQLFAVKVLNKEGSGFLTNVIGGILWCAGNRIQVANMSLGDSHNSFFMHQAIKYAKSRGVAFVAAAGNSSGAVDYPGAFPEVIAVSATDQKDKLAYFSSRGPQVAFAAPGVDVKSSVPGGGYDFLDGTSMASPHVAGLAALAVARGARSPDAVRAALKAAAKPIGLSPQEQGSGMIDAGLLVR